MAHFSLSFVDCLIIDLDCGSFIGKELAIADDFSNHTVDACDSIGGDPSWRQALPPTATTGPHQHLFLTKHISRNYFQFSRLVTTAYLFFLIEGDMVSDDFSRSCFGNKTSCFTGSSRCPPFLAWQEITSPHQIARVLYSF